jgi:hypothetical protein
MQVGDAVALLAPAGFDVKAPATWAHLGSSISRQSLGVVFGSAGYESVVTLGTRPSVYQRADLYAAQVTR